MSYKIGTYRTHLGIELDLDDLALEEGRLFFWLMENTGRQIPGMDSKSIPQQPSRKR